MIRTFAIGLGGVALLAGTASAAFVGVEIREDKTVNAGPADLRVFNFYAKFNTDPATDPTSAVLNVGQANDANNWGIDTLLNPGAAFFQVMTPVIGGPNNTAPNSQFFAFDATFQFDTYFSIGRKTQNPAMGIVDSTSLDPSFSITTDTINGGWFNSSPPNNQGRATFNAEKGTWDTFIAQVSIVGLADDAANAFGESNALSDIPSSIFRGGFVVFTQAAGQGATPNQINFIPIPAPGALALFGAAGLVGLRRRRA
ncbi:MAG: hypothetical protein VYC34_04285 [Planctomycetota bacterium]|nr:hypothetical protein [Planctomycetota bacterium]